MITPRLRFAAVAATLAVTALVASACAAEPQPADTPSSAPTPAETAPAPDAEPAPTEPAPGPGDPTCDTIIPESTVADFESLGWTYKADVFYVGELELSDGLQCVWADFDAPASDHLQLFGWAPITAADADTAQDSLVSQGWVREEGPEGVYITENPNTTIAVDDEGYGMTYLFADGWVKLADTKQGLLLVEWTA